MKIIKQLFEFVIFVQTIMFLLFIILNINNLNDIIVGMVIEGNNEEFSVNFYSILIVVGALMLLGIVASLNLFGGGLNEEGSRLLMRYLSFFLFIALLFTGSMYFLFPLGVLGVILNILFVIVSAMYILDSMMDREY